MSLSMTQQRYLSNKGLNEPRAPCAGAPRGGPARVPAPDETRFGRKTDLPRSEVMAMAGEPLLAIDHKSHARGGLLDNLFGDPSSSTTLIAFLLGGAVLWLAVRQKYT